MGILLHQKLNWGPHIGSVAAKASRTIGFLRRNLRYCPPKLKATAYITLVRSKLDYCSTIWDPHLEKDIKALEAVQRRAARFVCNDYSRYSSVSSMLEELQWPSLEHRRKLARLTLMYKVVNDLVAVPHGDHLRPGSTRTRGLNSQKFMNIGVKTDHYKHSFFPRTVRDWNALSFTPPSDLSTFKLQVGLQRD